MGEIILINNINGEEFCNKSRTTTTNNNNSTLINTRCVSPYCLFALVLILSQVGALCLACVPSWIYKLPLC